MAATKYSQHVKHNARRAGRMAMDEFRIRQREMAARGNDLPQSKLTDADVMDIRSAKKQRESMLKYIRENISNEAMARKYGTTERNIEKIVSYATWSHVA